MKEILKKIVLSFYYRFFGKKFFVFLASCVLLWVAKITPEIWQYITIAFLTAEGGRDISDVIKGKISPKPAPEPADEKGS